MMDWILHKLFNIVSPQRGRNWLSIRYHKWKYARQKEWNKQWVEGAEDTTYFHVPGAGYISISNDCHHMTGKVVGFSLGAEWGTHGYAGGVLGRDEAVRLANFLLLKCSEVTETMEEEREKTWQRLKQI